MLKYRENQETIEELRANLQSGETCALIGAGVSVNAGYPSWPELINRMKEKAVKGLSSDMSPKQISQLSRIRNHGVKNDALWHAELYRGRMHVNEYYQLLTELFGPVKEMEAGAKRKICSIAHLGFRHIFTTNYDNSVEQVFRASKQNCKVLDWNNRKESSEFLRTSRRGSSSYYVYLHGRYDCPEEIILTENDYLRRYYYSDEAKLTLFSVFMSHPIVFLGFSLTDPEITHLLRITRGFTASANFQHFAILPLEHPSEELIIRRYLNDKYGIKPVFYEVGENVDGKPDHSSLFVLVEDLLRSMGRNIDDLGLCSEDKASERREYPGIAAGIIPPFPAGNIGMGDAVEGIRTEELGVMPGRENIKFLSPSKPDHNEIISGINQPPAISDTGFPVVPPFREPVLSHSLNPESRSNISELPLSVTLIPDTIETDPDDPQKGKWGGSPVAGNIILKATVKPTRKEGWYRINLTVQKKLKRGEALTGSVKFYLHPSFDRNVELVQVKNGKAQLPLRAYGAFTVGAETEDGKKLELDLAQLENAPEDFRKN